MMLVLIIAHVIQYGMVLDIWILMQQWPQNVDEAKPVYLVIDGLADLYGYLEESDIKYICDWPKEKSEITQAMQQIIKYM